MRKHALTRALSIVTLALGCTPPNHSGDAAECEETTGFEEGTADELSELMAELIAPRICDQAAGTFIGLPGEQSNDGVAGGLDPSVGRWWIRSCEAAVEDGRLSVSIAGPGWTWLDRESMGFRVRQYLRFQGSATLSASLHVGYDAESRTATIWLRPAPGVRANIEPTGLIQAQATGIFSSMLGGILDLTGSSANDRARQQAAEEGSERLAAKLQSGFTVTFQLDNEQMDFMLGQLERGERPQRPWGDGEAAWLVNERSVVWPGGLDVLGPIPNDVGTLNVDVELEEGDGATVRLVCADELAQWLDRAWSGTQQGPVLGAPVADLRATHSPSSVQLAAAECRALLVVAPREGATLPSMLRYRVVSGDALEAASRRAVEANGGQQVASNGQPVPTPAARPTAVRVQIRGLSVEAETASGGAWDMLGGEPDPYVIVTSIRRGEEIDRTDVVDDNREPRFDRWLPGAVQLADFPLRFAVYDEDVTGDEVVGSADLEATVVPAQPADITLEIRSQGATARRTGVLRISVTPVR